MLKRSVFCAKKKRFLMLKRSVFYAKKKRFLMIKRSIFMLKRSVFFFMLKVSFIPAEQSTVPFVTAFDTLLSGPFKHFLDKSNEVGETGGQEQRSR